MKMVTIKDLIDRLKELPPDAEIAEGKFTNYYVDNDEALLCGNFNLKTKGESTTHCGDISLEGGGVVRIDVLITEFFPNAP